MHSVSSAQQLLIKIAKWARLRSQVLKNLPQFPPLKRRGAVSVFTGVTNEFSEKAEIFKKKFFPPPPQADLSDFATAVYP